MTEINWDLIERLRDRDHPLANIGTERELAKVDHVLPPGVGEVLMEARVAHNLLDLAKVPHGKGYSSDLDARTYQLVMRTPQLEERLDRIATWHSRDDLSGGLVGRFCRECEMLFPCDTYRMCMGEYVDPEERQGVPA